MDKRDKILEVAKELRTALGCAHGCCFEASVLLAAMLRKKGFKPKLVRGAFYLEYGEEDGREDGAGMDARHCWVTCSGFLVDITADQFNDEMEDDEMPVVVLVPVAEASWRYSKGKEVRDTPMTPAQALSSISNGVSLASLGLSPDIRRKENPMKMKVQAYQALRNFLRVEIRNEDQGGVRPATLGSALDSWEQAPDDVLKSWCGNKASLKEVKAELRALVKKHGAGEGAVHFV